MVTIEYLKPFHLIADQDLVYIYLESKGFKVAIEDEIYQFVPEEANEIKIDRKTQKIENTNDVFAFQKDSEIIFITMNELINIPDFLIKIYFITKGYFHKDVTTEKKAQNNEIDLIINELEYLNKKNLIDKALDERDEDAFYALVKIL